MATQLISLQNRASSDAVAPVGTPVISYVAPSLTPKVSGVNLGSIGLRASLAAFTESHRILAPIEEAHRAKTSMSRDSFHNFQGSS